MAIDQSKVDHWFKTPGKLSQEQCVRLDAVRASAKNLAESIIGNVPPCADQSDAVRKTREALLMAEEAIRNG
jgi:hypothetical protein